MKKTVAALALATAGLIAAPISAQTTDGNYQPAQSLGAGNWFVNGSVGAGHMADHPYDNHPTTYDLNIGYRWKIGPDMGFGLEIGYNDMGTSEHKLFQNTPYAFTEREDLRGWTAGVNGKINLWRGLYWSGRAGAYGWSGHGYDNDLNRTHQSGTSWYVGTGVGYDFNENFGIGLAYDYYKADMSRSVGVWSTDALSLTAEYRF